MFELKFGTPKPVCFRECWERGGVYVDIDLEARFAAKAEVFDYDRNLYDSEETVISEIKANGSEMIAKCLKEDWPENTPIAKSMFKGLEGLLDQELERRGIKARTEFISKVLTPESEEDYKNLIDRQRFHDPVLNGWDHICEDAINSDAIEGKYRLRFSDPFLVTEDGQIYYAPGEEVVVVYGAVASDTAYNFEVSAPDVKYEYGSTIKIKFVMPEHDVTISVGSKPYGPNIDLFEKQLKELGTQFMMMQGSAPATSGYVCECGYTGPFGKFCPNCGRAVDKQSQ